MESRFDASEQDEPKGLMRLPPELRVKIYKDVLLSQRRCNASCSVNHVGGSELASTREKGNSSLLSMNLFWLHPSVHFGGKRRLTTGNNAHVAILRTSRKVFEEASVVLYEHASLNIEQPYGYGPFSTADSVRRILKLCPAYGINHVQHLSLAFRVNDEKTSYLPSHGIGQWSMPSWRSWARQCEVALDQSMFPKMKVIELHFDIDLGYATHGASEPDAQPFECLHAIADRVQFVVDYHIYRAFVDDGSGWASEMIDNEVWLEGEETQNAQAWASLKRVAVQMRKQFIDELSKTFERRGKQLKLKEKEEEEGGKETRGTLEVNPTSTANDQPKHAV